MSNNSKKYTKMAAIVLLVCVLLIGWSNDAPVYAQQSNSDELSDLISKVVVLSAAVASEEYTVAHIEVDHISEGNTYTFRRKLYAGNHYKIVGIGGMGIRDLDVKVYKNGYLVGKDTQTDNLPEVDIYPSSTGDYSIQVKFYDRESFWPSSKEAYFVVIIAYK